MSDTEEPCRSRRLVQFELEAGLLPPSATASPAAAPPLAAPPPPAVRAPALPPVVLRMMPLRGSPAPIGYIYNATPDADGAFWQWGWRFSPIQGHQVFHDPCPILDAYCWAMGVTSPIVSIDRLPNHILSFGLEILEGLFAPSLTNSLGTAFMAAYLTSPPSLLALPQADRWLPQPFTLVAFSQIWGALVPKGGHPSPV
jgi:hypothetical protein